jgi:argininosuccinate lyase
MPQKINPDVLELTRGKTARVIGNLQALLVLVKGLPLAYNRDLQEDKERIFDSFDTVELCLELAAPLVAGMTLNRTAIAERLDRGHLDATTLMEWLIQRGTPQRTAHHMVGQSRRPGGPRLPAGGFIARRVARPIRRWMKRCTAYLASSGRWPFRSHGSTAAGQ